MTRLNETPSHGKNSGTSGRGNPGQKKRNYIGVLILSMIRILMGFNTILNGPFFKYVTLGLLFLETGYKARSNACHLHVFRSEFAEGSEQRFF